MSMAKNAALYFIKRDEVDQLREEVRMLRAERDLVLLGPDNVEPEVGIQKPTLLEQVVTAERDALRTENARLRAELARSETVARAVERLGLASEDEFEQGAQLAVDEVAMTAMENDVAALRKELAARDDDFAGCCRGDGVGWRRRARGQLLLLPRVLRRVWRRRPRSALRLVCFGNPVRFDSRARLDNLYREG